MNSLNRHLFFDQQHGLFWRLLVVVVLLAGAAFVWHAVNKVEYRWGWERIPRYFFYQSEEALKAPFDCTVTAVKIDGGTAVVTLGESGGHERLYTLPAPGVVVSAGEELLEGDTIGRLSEWRFGPLMRGLWVTVWISAFSSVIALVIGLVAGLARVSRNCTLRTLAFLYVETIRGTPLLVQIYIAYFLIGTVLPIDQWLGLIEKGLFFEPLQQAWRTINLSARDLCGIGALALFTGAYVAEIVRAGIQAIPKGQMEAARSLGMSGFQTMKDVILPQAFKKVMPPLAGQFISLIKDSSLVSIIGIIDLTRTGRDIASTTFATFEIWLTVAAMYLLVTTLLSQVVYFMERRFAVGD